MARQHKTPQQRAEETLAVAERKRDRLSELAGRMHDDLRDVQTALADAEARLDYARNDPALQGSTTTSSTTNQAGATA